MHNEVLTAIEKNSDKIACDVLAEIFSRPEARYYLAASEDAVLNRISNVVRYVCGRLEKWSGKKEPMDLVLDRYVDLGAIRCRQCMPLEEVIAVLSMVRKEVCNIIATRLAADHTYANDEPRDVDNYVNQLFDAINQSVITGYLNEQAVIAGRQKSGKLRSREVTWI